MVVKIGGVESRELPRKQNAGKLIRLTKSAISTNYTVASPCQVRLGCMKTKVIKKCVVCKIIHDVLLSQVIASVK